MQPIKSKMLTLVKQREFYRQLVRERDALLAAKAGLEKALESNRHLLDYKWFVEPGHFYSPLLGEHEHPEQLFDLWNPALREVSLPGIALNTAAQWRLLAGLAEQSKELAGYPTQPDIRYRFDNDQFGKSDTSFLYLALRHFKPKQIIEVGSGWSSALMLDINELYPQQAAKLTFIDPYPERLYGALKPADKKHCTVVTEPVQHVEPARFEKLRPGDLLFIDNSHVSKSGSDVNYMFFDILPRLKKGVIIHIHDVFYPFEYPRQWIVEDKRNWNEVYMVRALLTGSSLFEIILWPSYLMTLDRPRVEKAVPPASDLGASIWLRKI